MKSHDPDDRDRRLARLEKVANRMDYAFRVPVVGIRVGWDGIIGLIPVIGDAAALAPGAWIVLESHRMGAPRHILVRQGVNVALDTIIGTIPFVGDLFDVGFKSNRRNVRLLRDHFARHARSADAAASTPEGEGRLSSHHPSLGGGHPSPQPTSSSPAKK
ncbi:hypothetical protein OCGS_0053 [Oceaniovalibus guishaninsula JLT2003]|uniref:DUF4112 domain-containing protein n=1 Tax=Oceaniovalibus guishaninsula JLT2003 TaxID=1231392 RepID=K2HHB5_9RHOB|nr:DUF4112 domain-containing protein [Oceaniovalibus guishaninsula]EKE45827.1 hypothetical protein OCGS_0053 [Oceaniovalibus guishaninsula JLT2003]